MEQGKIQLNLLLLKIKNKLVENQANLSRFHDEFGKAIFIRKQACCKILYCW